MQERRDSISFDIDHSLDATGLYQWALTNDLQPVEFEYVPNTGIGAETPASWTGTVIVTVPGVEASERGSRLTGTVEWTGAGTFAFTAAA